jgi:hypothetical protein
MPDARLHDSSTIAIAVYGAGPTLLLPDHPRPSEGPQADEMRTWGAAPTLGHALITALSDACRVVAFDYAGQTADPHPGASRRRCARAD